MKLLPAETVRPNSIHNLDLAMLCNALPENSVDLLLCDLPYGTTACSWDSVIPFPVVWRSFERVIKPGCAIVLTAAQPFTSALIMSNPALYKYSWVWRKNSISSPGLAHKQPLRITEDIAVFNVHPRRYFPQGLKPFGQMVNKGTRRRAAPSIMAG